METVRANGLSDGYIRLVVTRGVGEPWGSTPPTAPRASVFIIATTISLYPAEDYENGLEIITVPTQRFSVGSLNARVKSCNYLNSIMGKIEAQVSGVREALMLNREGFVVECTADNVFIVKDGVLITPPPSTLARCAASRATPSWRSPRECMCRSGRSVSRALKCSTRTNASSRERPQR